MRPYVIDTNLYVEALRSEVAADALERFYLSNLPRVYLHSVVVQELLAGAVGPDSRKRIYHGLIEPLERAGRIITPSYRAWKRAGEILAELVGAGRLSAGGFGRGFVNDCLLAASARERGFTIVTRNLKDFERIGAAEPHSVAPPWPRLA